MSTASERDEGSARTFGALLQQIDAGDVHAEASEKLRELVERLAERSEEDGEAKGSLVLTLKFAAKKGQVTVTADVKTTAPKKARPASQFWLTVGNHLTTKNPRQQTLPLVEVNVQKNPHREPEPARAAEAKE